MTQYSPTVQNLLNRIDSLQEQIEAMRPIKPELVARIFQKFRLDWNYNSNSIEGNSLNYGETVAFLMEGLTAKGKPLKDHLDIKGHNEAIDFLLDMQKQGSELMERDIRGLHQMILVEPYQSKAQTAYGQPTSKTIKLGEYKTSPNHVETRTGEIHYYASPEETPALMQELMSWYREQLHTMHPLVLSALFHHKFVAIHPFDDGNGRMSRLLSNLILMQAGLPPIVVRQDQRTEYYGVLSQADAGVTEPLLEYFANLLINSLNTYLRGAKGEDITEPSDLEKEIALFIASFDEEELNKVPLSEDVLMNTKAMVFDNFIPELQKPVQEISKLFFDTTINFHSEISSGFISRDTKNYKKVPSSVFFVESSANEPPAVKIIMGAYRDGINEGESIKIAISINYQGFKANEKVRDISRAFIFDFHKSYYSMSILNTDDGEVQKGYPKHLSRLEAHTLIKKFFQELMNSIKADINA